MGAKIQYITAHHWKTMHCSLYMKEYCTVELL